MESARKLAEIQQFWQWFSQVEQQAHAEFMDDDKREKFFETLSTALKAVNDELVFEFGGMPDSETIEFAISADGIKAAFPDVIALFKAAPSFSPRWEIVAFRQRHPSLGLQLRLDGRKLDYDDIYFLYAIAEDDPAQRLHLQLHIRQYHEEIQWAVYLLLDSLLGEYDAIMEIVSIDWVDLDENNIKHLTPLVGLRDFIDERHAQRNTLN